LKFNNKELCNQIDNLEKTARRQTAELDASKAVHMELIAKHSALRNKCSNQENVVKLKDEELHSLTQEKHSSEEEHNQQFSTMKKSMKSLQVEMKERFDLHEKDKSTKDVEIAQLMCNNKEFRNQISSLEKSAQGRKEELDASTSAYQELLLERSALEGKWKNQVNLIDEELESLKNENQRLLAMNESMKSLEAEIKERADLYEKDKSSKEAEIAHLKVINEDLRNQIHEKKKESENLQSGTEKLARNIAMLEENNISNHSCSRNEHLLGRLNEGLKYSNSTQEGIAIHARESQSILAGSSSGTDTVGSKIKSKSISEFSGIAKPATQELSSSFFVGRFNRTGVKEFKSTTRDLGPVMTSQTTRAAGKLGQNFNFFCDQNNDAEEKADRHSKESPACTPSSPSASANAVCRPNALSSRAESKKINAAENMPLALSNELYHIHSHKSTHNQNHRSLIPNTAGCEVQSDHFVVKRSPGEFSDRKQATRCIDKDESQGLDRSQRRKRKIPEVIISAKRHLTFEA